MYKINYLYILILIFLTIMFYGLRVYSYDISANMYLKPDCTCYIMIDSKLDKPYQVKITDKALSVDIVDRKIDDEFYEIKVNPSHEYNINLIFEEKKKRINYNGVLKSYELFNKLNKQEIKTYIRFYKHWMSGKRKYVVKRLIEEQFKIQKIKSNIPTIKYKLLPSESNAYYIHDKNVLVINKDLLSDNRMIILKTIAHECRHIYQYEYTKNHSDKYSQKLEKNFDNYSEDDYKSNFVEKDAINYAKKYELLPYYIAGFNLFDLKDKQ